jgi:hypothetical protein
VVGSIPLSSRRSLLRNETNNGSTINKPEMKHFRNCVQGVAVMVHVRHKSDAPHGLLFPCISS